MIGKRRLRLRAASTRFGAMATLVLLSLGFTACSFDELDWPLLQGPEQQVVTPPTKKPTLADAAVTPTYDVVSRLQRQLTALGYDAGPIDGLYGPKSTAAVQAYREAQGLPAADHMTESLLTRLAEDTREAYVPEAQAKAPEATATAPLEAVERDGIDAETAQVEQTVVEAPKKTGGPALPLPTYLADSRYVYDDGEVFHLRAIQGNELRWRSAAGATKVTHRNFLLPPLAWSHRVEDGRRQFLGDPFAFWPRPDGEAVTISSVASVHSGNRPESSLERPEIWQCKHVGDAQIDVSAGRFNTDKFRCEGGAMDATSPSVQLWYYDEVAGHVILQEDLSADGTIQHRRALVAIDPRGKDWPPAVRAGLGWALQDALESLPSDESYEWRSSGVDTVVEIRPGDTFKDGQGTVCRHYRQVWVTGGDAITFPAVACRNFAGEWHIPGLDTAAKVAKGGN